MYLIKHSIFCPWIYASEERHFLLSGIHEKQIKNNKEKEKGKKIKRNACHVHEVKLETYI